MLVLEKREEAEMSTPRYALMRANALRAYVIFSPSSTFDIRHDLQKEHMRITSDAMAGQFDIHSADLRLAKLSLREAMGNDSLCLRVEHDWALLSRDYFGSVWLYGDITSDFVRAVVNLAICNKMRIKNNAIEDSLLDRYLRGWIGRFSSAA